MTAATPTTVTAYLNALNGDALAVATRCRDIILNSAPDVTETMRYQMPCFLVGGTYLVYFGAWKQHIGLYPVPRLDAELEAQLAPYRAANDTVRFRYKDPIPWDLVERVVAEMVSRLASSE